MTADVGDRPSAADAGGRTGQAREHSNDAELVAAYRRNPDLFTAVHDRYFREIYRYVAGRLDAQVAEDITAETFCEAFGRRDRFDPERGSLRSWLFGIATNLVARHRRKEARRLRALARVKSEPTDGGHENSVVSAVTAQRLRPQLARALRKLSPGERDVLLLVALADLSYDEIAQALGISPGTVGSRLSRARTKLNKTIDRESLHG